MIPDHILRIYVILSLDTPPWKSQKVYLGGVSSGKVTDLLRCKKVETIEVYEQTNKTIHWRSPFFMHFDFYEHFIFIP